MPSRRDNSVQPENGGGRPAARAGRLVRHRWPYLSVAAAAALVTGVITATAGHAATGPATPAACMPGYLCLALSPGGTGNVALIAAGQNQGFARPGLRVTELVNNTSTLYCTLVVTSNGATLSGTIPAGGSQTVSESVLAVSPGPVCPA